MSELALRLIRENIQKHQRGEDATTLDLGRCGLTHLPPELGECVWLETLILSSVWREYNIETKELKETTSQNKGKPNRIASVKGVERLMALKRLVVAKYYRDGGENWELKDLSPLAGLQHLQQLDCSDTQVADLSQLTGLQNLQQLKCSNTQIADLSPLARMQNLQILDCQNTKIANLSPLAGMQNVQKLDCSFTPVADLSPLAGMQNLQKLYCFGTQVSDLSPLAGMQNLQELNCQNTKVANLSPLAGMQNLQILFCSSTLVADLSPLAGLQNLQILFCSSTLVADLSPLAGLQNLQTLYCASTPVADLSPLAGLQNLQRLYCHNTPVADLSPLTGLQNLQILNCSDTRVADLSPLLPLIKKGMPVKWERSGDGIMVEGCPLTNPPIEIVKQGNEAILNYFREREKQQVVRLREAKLLLLGEPGAGKTTLAVKIKDLNAKMPEKDKSTKGIYVETLHIGEGDKAFDIHLWDFGGQHIYQGTHRFFLTKRSLYVVVADNRRQDTDFNYWLQMAELYSDGSPLYIVVNQSDNRPPYPNINGMREHFPILKDMLAANLDTLDEINNTPDSDLARQNRADTQRLVDILKTRIQELPHVGQELPKSWFDIRTRLTQIGEKEPKDYISLERYYDICRENGIPERDRMLYLSAYLHDLGAILHFQEDATLRETVILNMRWATDAVFAAYDSPAIHSGERPGFFKKADIAAIWHDDRYCDKQEQLLALMMRFKLCYRIGESDDYVMPELLPFAQPDYATNIPGLDRSSLDQSPPVRYSYGFMPKGIFGRFAVQIHRMIAWKQQFIWREGVVLQSGDSYALITETYGNRELVVRAVGSRRRELMTIATYHLDEIHATFPKIKVEKLIPCICNTCKNEQVPHYYDFNNLQDRLERRKETAECAKSFEDVSVRALLNAVFQKEAAPALEEKLVSDTDATIRLFISYSKQDKDWLEQLKMHLVPLQRREKIEVWFDEKLSPGSVWDQEIKYRLATADIILLLVSPDFLATEYIWDVEIKEAIRRHEEKEATVIPVILRPSDWLNTPLKDLSALPLKGMSIAEATSRDAALTGVVRELSKVITNIKIK
jgi:internalin A